MQRSSTRALPCIRPLFGASRTNIATSSERDRPTPVRRFRVPGIATGRSGAYELLQRVGLTPPNAIRDLIVRRADRRVSVTRIDARLGHRGCRPVGPSASTTDVRRRSSASAASVDREAIVFPAPPEHGKTTTVAALVRAGYALPDRRGRADLRRDGLVHPFPRPLSISPSSMAGPSRDLKGTPPQDTSLFRHFRHHVAAGRPPAAMHLGARCAVRSIVVPFVQRGARHSTRTPFHERMP